MTNKLSTRERITESLKYLRKMPDGTYFYFDYAGGLQLEANTLEEVKTLRRCFRGVVWKKSFQEYNGAWTYRTTTKSGADIRITGCKEGPKQCKMVEETVMEERSVPIGYKKEMVEVKKVRYICPDGDKVR